jgi:hypothetical protein
MHWRLTTEHAASGQFSSDERLKPAPEPLTPAEVAQLYWEPRERPAIREVELVDELLTTGQHWVGVFPYLARSLANASRWLSKKYT